MSLLFVDRARLNETLARLERVVNALDDSKENLAPALETKSGGFEQSVAVQALLFPKQVAESLLGSKQL